ncbi:MAG: DHA2 family efflux MFS transporter permease subunit [Deltaproteobacteria bacterium]|nr:DHA2 family efflux MFS transporter permease subunit [Deltaproteobacteria bacterium]
MKLPPLEGHKLALLTIALPLATFMQVVDATIANVAVPTIAGNLGASYTQGTWIITSYSVANAIVLPLTGRLSQRFGEVRLFLWSTALFSMASFLCGLSTDLSFLVVSRIIQGAAGGPMMPLAQSLLMQNYPKQRQIMALAFWSTTASVAPVCGPILGGIISDNYHWSWIFLINVPLGAIVIFMTRSLLSNRETPLSRPRWSAISFAFLAIGIGSLQMLLDKGKELDWFNSNIIIALAVFSVVGITFLILWEKHNPSPLIDLELFRSRNFTVGVTLISLGMMIYLGTVVLLPLLLQSYFGYTATWAGIVSAPVGILPVLLPPLVGRFSAGKDLRYIITLSFLIFAGCMYLRTFFAPNANLYFILVPQTLQGAALALFFVPIITLTFIGLEPSKLASGSGVFNCIRTLFAGIGASLVTTLWERREAFHHNRLVSSIDGMNPNYLAAMEVMQTSGLDETTALANIARQISSQGFIMSAAEIYQLCVYAFFGMILLTWFAKPPKR